MNETAILFWSQIVNTVIQTLSLIFLVIYVIKTWQMASSTKKAAEATEATVNEMRDARRQDTSPYVIAYFDAPPGSHLLYLVIKNIGRSTATNIKLKFTPALTCSSPETLQHLTLLRDGIASMPPDYEIRTFLDSAPQYYSNDTFPLAYEVVVSFEGGLLQERMQTVQTLDLSAFKGITSIRRKDIHDLVSEFSRFVQENQRASHSIQGIEEILEDGIWIANPILAVTEVQPNSENWKTVLFGKLEEFRLNWKYTYQEDRKTSSGLSKLQRYTRLVSEQAAGIWTGCATYATLDVSEKTVKIISLLHEIGTFQFYIGNESLKKFNELGDETVTAIEDLTGKQAEIDQPSTKAFEISGTEAELSINGNLE